MNPHPLPDLPPLITRGDALALTTEYHLPAWQLDLWRRSGALVPVQLPHRWEHYRTAELRALATATALTRQSRPA